MSRFVSFYSLDTVPPSRLGRHSESQSLFNAFPFEVDDGDAASIPTFGRSVFRLQLCRKCSPGLRASLSSGALTGNLFISSPVSAEKCRVIVRLWVSGVAGREEAADAKTRGKKCAAAAKRDGKTRNLVPNNVIITEKSIFSLLRTGLMEKYELTHLQTAEEGIESVRELHEQEMFDMYESHVLPVYLAIRCFFFSAVFCLCSPFFLRSSERRCFCACDRLLFVLATAALIRVASLLLLTQGKRNNTPLVHPLSMGSGIPLNYSASPEFGWLET